MPTPTNDRHSTAVHEAGHTLVAWYCTAVHRVSEASLQPTEGVAGQVSYESDPSLEHTAWCMAVISLAGLAAEAKVFGTVRSKPSSQDLQRALARIREASGAYPWDHPGKSLPFRDIFRDPITDREADHLARAFRTASTLLDAHDHLFREVTSRLLANSVLREDVLTSLLGPRRQILRLGIQHRRGFFVRMDTPVEPPNVPSLWDQIKPLFRFVKALFRDL